MAIPLSFMLNHRYRERVIVPYVAIQDNITFLTCNKEDRYLITSDGVTCKVITCKEGIIFKMEKDIMTLYKIDAYEFLRKWYVAAPYIDSLHLLDIKMVKHDIPKEEIQ